MSFVTRRCIRVGVLGLLVSQLALAQEVINLETLRVTFPTKDWKRTEPPADRLRAEQEKAALKLLLYAESGQSKLKLHITQFEYGAGGAEPQLASLVDDVKKRYQAHAVGPVSESFRQVGGFPSVEFTAHYRGWGFLQGRVLFCGKRVYLVEVGGPTDCQPEASVCWNGVTLVGETPLGAESFAKVADLRQREAPKVMTSKARRQTGYYVLMFVGGVALLLGVLAVAIRVARRIRSRPHWNKHRKRRNKS